MVATRKTKRTNLEITVLKQGTSSKKVLSVSFFTMKDAYRPIEYYEKNLQQFLCYKKVLKGFETRIYTDDSGKEIVLKAAKNDPTISIYHYNYPPLREEIGHIGTFGTFVRFLPLFDPEVKTVWISDVDIFNSDLNPSLLTKMKTANADFCFRSYLCYNKKIYGQPYTIVANLIISFITFPMQLFTQFLHKLTTPTKSFQLTLDALNQQMVLKRKPTSRVPYGIDEVFMNDTFYTYLINNSINCYILKDYIYATEYLRWNKVLTKDEDMIIFLYYKNSSQQSLHKVKKLLEQKIPLLVERYPCLQEVLDKMNLFKTSFLIPLLKKGKELSRDED
jgi:hypothetical protein